jgi:allophanate hydrolase
VTLMDETGVGPVAAVTASLAADRAHDDTAIWITRLDDAAVMARAQALQAEGRRDRALWGVPFAVKDNIDVAGLPTTAACPGFAYTATETAPVVQAMLDAGAVLIGKTNLDQFATGLVGVRSPYGVPRNVFNAAYVPGGSSSGSGCAVAAGIVAVALGTDTAGSGRVPAAFGNIVGLKPTIGSLSNRGMVPACQSIDTISIFARTVDEALAVARVVAGPDQADPYSRKAPAPYLRRSAPAGGRVAYAAVTGCTPEIERLYHQAATRLGAESVDITPFLTVARLLYDGPWVAERTAALRAQLATPEMLFPATRTILESGMARLAVDAFDAFHLLAQARREAAKLFAQYDALLLPTVPNCPTLADVEADPLGPNRVLGMFTNFVNLCDLAGWAVPAGMGSDGMPVGVTLLGPAWSEGRLAALADSLHRANAATVGATAAPLPPSAAPDPVSADQADLPPVPAGRSTRHDASGGWHGDRRRGLGAADHRDRRAAGPGAGATRLRHRPVGGRPLPGLPGRSRRRGWGRGYLAFRRLAGRAGRRGRRGPGGCLAGRGFRRGGLHPDGSPTRPGLAPRRDRQSAHLAVAGRPVAR